MVPNGSEVQSLWCELVLNLLEHKLDYGAFDYLLFGQMIERWNSSEDLMIAVMSQGEWRDLRWRYL